MYIYRDYAKLLCQKYRQLSREYQEHKQKSQKSGRGAVVWPFFDAMETLMSKEEAARDALEDSADVQEHCKKRKEAAAAEAAEARKRREAGKKQQKERDDKLFEAQITAAENSAKAITLIQEMVQEDRARAAREEASERATESQLISVLQSLVQKLN